MKNILNTTTIKNLGSSNFVPKFERFTCMGHSNFCNILDLFNFELGRKIFVPKIFRFIGIRLNKLCKILNNEFIFLLKKSFSLKNINLGRKNFGTKFLRFTKIIAFKFCKIFSNINLVREIFEPKISRFTSIRPNNFCKILDNRFAIALFEGPHQTKFNTRKVSFGLAEGAKLVSKFTSRRVAFTLAEVLITIVIVGAVAAMTLPNLMQAYTNHITEVRLKKFTLSS